MAGLLTSVLGSEDASGLAVVHSTGRAVWVVLLQSDLDPGDGVIQQILVMTTADPPEQIRVIGLMGQKDLERRGRSFLEVKLLHCRFISCHAFNLPFGVRT